ncbi:hypothetical protein LY01_01027 [Nonlabens xylanidelens]|uniref:Uncharacterized protein n=1 Tax=Nonlabens xylanidelens TaxID=191564 RepID=A0A2S6IMS3_9FLAO|nr:hypothetical protein [Nonlabens xylanidelens]PPK95440.1 hypothetical protein LY01_01027 [Nonlabens xylanidelens]PQJ22260.1 hypothetical protein BST94_01400 [Nonlabens xylanidelens]
MNHPTKHITELSEQEIIELHLDRYSMSYQLIDCQIRSTLSFLYEAIQHTTHNTRTKNLVPIMAILSALDQLGICYNRTDLSTNFTNGIKRCLILLAEKESDDNILKILPALRNGLIHNVSLVSKAKYENQPNFIFRYSNDEDDIDEVYQESSRVWDGNFSTLSNNGREHYTTLINIEKLKELFDNCLIKAVELNRNNLLRIRLNGGMEELFYNYLRTVPK